MRPLIDIFVCPCSIGSLARLALQLQSRRWVSLSGASADKVGLVNMRFESAIASILGIRRRVAFRDALFLFICKRNLTCARAQHQQAADNGADYQRQQ